MSDPAKPKDRVCTGVYDDARQAEAAGHLVQATELLLKCTRMPCSGFIRQQCASHYFQLEEDIPTVVPVATDELGAARVDVQVTMDGAVLATRLDGRSLPIDPGLHEFSFSADGVVARTKVMIVQGARNRPVTVSLPGQQAQKVMSQRGSSESAAAAKVAPGISEPDKSARLPETPALDATASDAPKSARLARAPSPTSVPESAASDARSAPKPSSGPGAAPYVVGAVGLAGIASYGLLTYWGRMDNQRLANCAPSCSSSSVDHIRKLYVAADVSLGVGIAGLGVATAWLLLGSRSPKKESPTPPAVALDVAPTPSGGFATVSGSF